MARLTPCLNCATPTPTRQGPRCTNCRPPARTKGARYPRSYRTNRARLLANCTPATPCTLCGHPLGDDRTQWTADHRTPVAAGGTHHLDNLDPAHQRCNSAKADRPLS